MWFYMLARSLAEAVLCRLVNENYVIKNINFTWFRNGYYSIFYGKCD